ncbi:MAG: hypothetical protein HQL95_04400 [Magnetococcales bacterium]|nr:hypothetical protein [Magnetococcales bacterium]
MTFFVSQRRLFLLQGLLLGLTLCNGGCVSPKIRQGIHRMEGELQVDGQSVGTEAIVRPGNTVATGSGGQTVLVMEEDAFLLGAGTTVSFHPKSPSVATTQTVHVHPPDTAGFTLHAGKILSVFGSGSRTLKVPSAVIGIRGTGIFLQVEPTQDYVCLCYGRADIRMNADPLVGESLETQHHESPRYLAPEGLIRKAPMLNHTDEELFMLEALVNRQPPFKRAFRRY